MMGTILNNTDHLSVCKYAATTIEPKKRQQMDLNLKLIIFGAHIQKHFPMQKYLFK